MRILPLLALNQAINAAEDIAADAGGRGVLLQLVVRGPAANATRQRWHALHDHFRDHGRQEGRRFGCEAAPLTAAEAARFPRPQVDQGRLHAADGFLAAELARRAPAVPIHDHGPLFFHF